MSRVWRRFARRRASLFGLSVVLALLAVALFADFIASDRPIAMRKGGTFYLLPNLVDYRDLRAFEASDLHAGDWALWPPLRQGPYTIPAPGTLDEPLPLPPGPGHPLGTDHAGRDTLARLLHGARTSLAVGIFGVLLQIAAGLLFGVLAGTLGGIADAVVTVASEVLLSFPLLLLLLAAQGVLEQTTLLSTIAVIGLTRWAETSRLVRAEALRVRELPFVEASRAAGSPLWRTALRHVLPNCLSPALVSAAFGVGSAILLESALSFLGFGAPEPTASWGSLMADGFQDVFDPAGRLLVLWPAFAIFLCVSAFNLVAEGLRDALDPRAQGAVAPSRFITSDQNRALSPAPMPEGADAAPATYSVPLAK